MKKKIIVVGVLGIGLLSFVLLQLSTGLAQKKEDTIKNKAMVERGRYLVTVGGCNDCHSTKVFGPQGPMVDSTKLLSGHPSTTELPEIPKGVVAPDKWGALTTNDLTAWAGPWGVSFTRNLTPDVSTGLGSWTESMFIKALRTGKDMGEGRDILPPMPWPNFAQMTDADLKAVFAYLRTLKPIENPVPDPISPMGERLPTGVQPKK
jgi:mono/diheme cytochrome c family protein